VNRELAEKVANAVLYEGYMLYPYRPSAIKNRQRWTFGILYPPSYCEVSCGTERSAMHTECLLEAHALASVHIEVRFLHLLARQVRQQTGEGMLPVPALTVQGRLIESWDEAVERSAGFEIRVGDPPREFGFSFPGSTNTVSLRDSSGQLIGEVRRLQHEVRGTVAVASGLVRDGVWKLTTDVENLSSDVDGALDRNAALLRSLLSAHALLTVNGGSFVSLLDPPNELQTAARACHNRGHFPVLLGAEGERDMLLCSPILLYDYPQIAPESAGDFCDATEMDEMLTLRLITLTDAEKAEIRQGDDRARILLARTEQGTREQLMRIHGTIRSLRPVSEP
jgi:hypothetical protein